MLVLVSSNLSDGRLGRLTTDLSHEVQDNRAAFLERHGIAKAKGIDDVIFCHRKGVFYYMLTADCLPLVLYDQAAERFVFIHANIQGLLSGRVDKCIRQFMAEVKGPESVKVYSGPAICGKCYLQRGLKGYFKLLAICLRFGSKYVHSNKVDLRGLAQSLLTRQGIPEVNIVFNSECTSCNDTLPSHTRDGQERKSNLMTVVGLR